MVSMMNLEHNRFIIFLILLTLTDMKVRLWKRIERIRSSIVTGSGEHYKLN